MVLPIDREGGLRQSIFPAICFPRVDCVFGWAEESCAVGYCARLPTLFGERF